MLIGAAVVAGAHLRSVLSWIIHGGGVLLLLLLFVMVAHALVWMVKTKRGHFFILPDGVARVLRGT